MIKLCQVIFTITLSLLVVGSVMAGSTPTDCVQPCIPDTGINAGDIQGPSVLCINEEGTYSIDASDSDKCGDPVACPDGVHGNWSWGSGAVASGTTSSANDICTHGPRALTCKWTTPGVKTITVTLNDDGKYANDAGSPQKTKDVIVIRLASIDIYFDPQEVHDPVTFIAETEPPGYAAYIPITWTGGEDPATGTGPSFTTKYHKAGVYTVTATACGESVQKTVRIVGGPFLTNPTPEPRWACHLRYFCGAPVPSPRDKAHVWVRDPQPPGTTYEWFSIGSSIEIRNISESGNNADVYPVCGSANVNDAYVQLMYHLDDFSCVDTNAIEYAKDPILDGLPYWRFYTVFQPASFEYFGRKDNPALPCGYNSKIQYLLRSTVQNPNPYEGYIYMAQLSYNEVFPSDPVEDVYFVTNNWDWGPCNSGFFAYILEDEIEFSKLSFGDPPVLYDPPAWNPQMPRWYLPVDHRQQEWYVGSTLFGMGCHVHSNVLQRYQDHATHLGVPDPPDGAPSGGPLPGGRLFEY